MTPTESPLAPPHLVQHLKAAFTYTILGNADLVVHPEYNSGPAVRAFC